MKSTLVASIPAFVVIFALVFGFGTFHVVGQNAEASDSEDECDRLSTACSEAQENASAACASGNVERCESAQAEAIQVCSEYANNC